MLGAKKNDAGDVDSAALVQKQVHVVKKGAKRQQFGTGVNASQHHLDSLEVIWS